MMKDLCLSGRFPVRVAFADFWAGFNAHDNVLQSVLTERLGAVVVDDARCADVLVYSVFGRAHLAFEGVRIFYTGESVLPWWDECDYAISFLRDGVEFPECHLRLPIWMNKDEVRFGRMSGMFSHVREEVEARHSRFCNFIYSNGRAPERVRFMQLLSQYKRVDCGGRLLNNLGGPVADKVEFCSTCKFTIAFENYPASGYSTEKLTDPLAALSVPIYWGDPDVRLDFNAKRMVHANDFASPEELVEYVVCLDRDDDLYWSYLTGDVFAGGLSGPAVFLASLERFFAGILANGRVLRHDRSRGTGSARWFGHALMPRFEDGKVWTAG